MGLRAEVVDLRRPDLGQQAAQPVGVGEVAVVQEEARLLMGVEVQVIDPLGAERRGAADHPVDLIVLGQQQLGQVRTVLPGDTGDQRNAASVHHSPNPEPPHGGVGRRITRGALGRRERLGMEATADAVVSRGYRPGRTTGVHLRVLAQLSRRGLHREAPQSESRSCGTWTGVASSSESRLGTGERRSTW
jgi:hypothetical protein